MAKLKEIETKWNADHVDRKIFNHKMKMFLREQKYKYSIKKAAGFDYYYESKDGVWRHRVSPDTNELTVKARMSSHSTKVRYEGNILLNKACGVSDVSDTLSLVGCELAFSIYKDCDIYFVHDGDAEISVVWYKVIKPGLPDRIFAEVEVHGIGEKKSVKLLNKWSKVMNKLYSLDDQCIINDSLYEIYSGKKYKIMKGKK